MRCDAIVSAEPRRADAGRGPLTWLLSSALLASAFSGAAAENIRIVVVDDQHTAAPADIPPGCYRWEPPLGPLVNPGGGDPRRRAVVGPLRRAPLTRSRRLAPGVRRR